MIIPYSELQSGIELLNVNGELAIGKLMTPGETPAATLCGASHSSVHCHACLCHEIVRHAWWLQRHPALLMIDGGQRHRGLRPHWGGESLLLPPCVNMIQYRCAMIVARELNGSIIRCDDCAILFLRRVTQKAPKPRMKAAPSGPRRLCSGTTTPRVGFAALAERARKLQRSAPHFRPESGRKA